MFFLRCVYYGVHLRLDVFCLESNYRVINVTLPLMCFLGTY